MPVAKRTISELWENGVSGHMGEVVTFGKTLPKQENKSFVPFDTSSKWKTQLMTTLKSGYLCELA